MADQERFVKLKRFSQEFDVDTSAAQLIPKTGTGTAIGTAIAAAVTAGAPSAATTTTAGVVKLVTSASYPSNSAVMAVTPDYLLALIAELSKDAFE